MSLTPRRILVGDDQLDVLQAAKLLLKVSGFRAETVDSPDAIVQAAATGQFDLILIDLNYTRDTTSGQEGLDILAALQAAGNQAPVIVMTAWSSIDLAVEATRRGAVDFIEKPWDNARLLSKVDKHLQLDAQRRKEQALSRREWERARSVQQHLLPRSAKR